jgi:adenosylcobinamide-GDP ribazoletransferase
MLKSLLAGWAFYTYLPAPSQMELDFSRIARWATPIGLVLGGLLAGSDWILGQLGMPLLVRSTLVVILWVAISGGLHLDGAMDSADGLAVTDPQRRLEVMADSNTGAFGALAAIAILLLKVTALSGIPDDRWILLLTLPAWGRWAHLLAVVFYPYLKTEGKGAMHSKGVEALPDLAGGLLAVVMVTSGEYYFHPKLWGWIVSVQGIGLLLSYPIGKYFAWRFGGHTGDTYGATVEWVEAIGLCLLSFPYWHGF